ncbi:Autophagy protein 22 [Dinochytrium kinnereticum]|nr:Autophagy protein 22 [Dinochytrium kinnereticum]
MNGKSASPPESFVPPARPLSTDEAVLRIPSEPAMDPDNQNAAAVIEMSGSRETLASSLSSSSMNDDPAAEDTAPPIPVIFADGLEVGGSSAAQSTRKPSVLPSDAATVHSSQASISIAESGASLVDAGGLKRAHGSGRKGNEEKKRFPFGFRFRKQQGEASSEDVGSSKTPSNDGGGKDRSSEDIQDDEMGDLKFMSLKNGPSHSEIDAQHPNNDHPPLSKDELKAFYIYSWAIEPIVVVAMTALIPLILQSLAAGNGKEADDLTKPCDYTKTGYRCVVQIAGAWVDPSSFALYTTACSVGLQAIVFISLGAMADHGAWRKRFMVGFMIGCAVFCMAFATIRNSSWFAYGSILMVASNVCLGASYVFYDAYIPLYARTHWFVTQRSFSTRKAKDSAVETVCNAISAYSSIIGYLGAIVCFAIAGGVSFLIQAKVPTDSPVGTGGFLFGNVGVGTYGQQIGVAVTGLWTFIGAYWPAKYMRTRKGPPLPKGENYLFYSWKRVWITFKRARKLPNTFLFLVAWFLLSDALTTVGSVTILFAQNELGFSSTEIVIVAIAAPLTAAGGNYLWLLFQQRFKWSTKSMIILLLTLMTALPIYGILGLFAPFGLRHKWELFPCGIYYGCLLGALQSFCRVLFSELLPPGQESEFFALYSITDKGSSWFGPLIVGAITDATHQIRYSFFFLLVMIALPVLFIWYLDPEKGRRDVEVARDIHDAEISGLGVTASTAV